MKIVAADEERHRQIELKKKREEQARKDAEEKEKSDQLREQKKIEREERRRNNEQRRQQKLDNPSSEADSNGHGPVVNGVNGVKNHADKKLKRKGKNKKYTNKENHNSNFSFKILKRSIIELHWSSLFGYKVRFAHFASSCIVVFLLFEHMQRRPFQYSWHSERAKMATTSFNIHRHAHMPHDRSLSTSRSRSHKAN